MLPDCRFFARRVTCTSKVRRENLFAETLPCLFFLFLFLALCRRAKCRTKIFRHLFVGCVRISQNPRRNVVFIACALHAPRSKSWSTAIIPHARAKFMSSAMHFACEYGNVMPRTYEITIPSEISIVLSLQFETPLVWLQPICKPFSNTRWLSLLVEMSGAKGLVAILLEIVKCASVQKTRRGVAACISPKRGGEYHIQHSLVGIEEITQNCGFSWRCLLLQFGWQKSIIMVFSVD